MPPLRCLPARPHLSACPRPPAPPPLQSGSDNVCLAFSENQCAGLCRSEQRLEGIYKDCVADPYNAGEWGGRQAAVRGAGRQAGSSEGGRGSSSWCASSAWRQQRQASAPG